MGSATPLSVLLSQVLVAFAIEFDNEFEHRLMKTWARPFRVSIVMWSNFMRFVREDGRAFEQLVALSAVPKEGVASVVGGMERWGYITVDHDPAHGVPPRRKGFGTGRGLRADTLIRPSTTGKVAQELWAPLVADIEARWQKRLGNAQVENLRTALSAVQDEIELAMPHFLPIVGGGGMFAHAELDTGASEADRDLPALLSRVLLAFTLAYEDGCDVSLPIGANVLRVLDSNGSRVADLPLLAGVSKEAVSMSMTWLAGADHIAVEPDPRSRGKIVRLTPKGRAAQDAYHRHLDEVETSWKGRYGEVTMGALRESLQHILDQPGGEDGPLSAGLVTPQRGWRATGRYKPLTAAFIKSPSDALPHYPMVLHRGGWPDGS